MHVAVIGAGVIGLATVYHLVKRGARVRMIDPPRDLQGSLALLDA